MSEVQQQESYHKQVRRIVESAIETGNYSLAQMYITEASEFDSDFGMAMQTVYDEAHARDNPTVLATH